MELELGPSARRSDSGFPDLVLLDLDADSDEDTEVEEEAELRQGNGLLFQLIRLMLKQSANSVYLLALASCLHKWVQASSVREQRLVALYPGLIPFLLQRLTATPLPPEPQMQVFLGVLTITLIFAPRG